MPFPKVSVTDGKEYERAPQGNHIARCYQVIDLGNQVTTYQGEERVTHQVLLGFELCNEPMTDGRPFSVSNTYSFSLGKKANLRRVVEGWIGHPMTDQEAAEFDLSSLAGKPCMVQVTHRTTTAGKTYTNLQAVTALPKGMTAPDPVNKVAVYTPTDHDQKAWDLLPPWLQKRIEARVNPSEARPFNDDIPF